jgi:glucosamine--fructose-6-phosphate aminotransferase (isomerizing)
LDTDTEVLVNLIEKYKTNKIRKAVQITLNQVVGAYASFVFDKSVKLWLPFRKSFSNWVGEEVLPPDASPFIEYTSNAVYLETNG